MGPLVAYALAAVGAAAALACLLRGRREAGGARGAWVMLATAAGLDAAFVAASAHGPPSGWVALPVLHVLAAAFAVVAVLRLSDPAEGIPDLLPAGRLGPRGRLAIEGGAAGLALALIVWQLILPSLAAEDGVGQVFAVLVIPMADVVVACTAVLALARARQVTVTPFRTLGAVAIGVGLHAAGSGLLGLGLATSSPVVLPLAILLIVAGDLGLMAGALRPVGESDTEREHRSRERAAVLAPVAPLVLAGVLWVGVELGGMPLTPVATALGICMILVLLAGAVIARLDNMQIARQLEERVSERTLDLGIREKWFRSLVQNSSDIVTVVDAQGVIRYQTPSIARILGHDPDALIGRRFATLLKPGDAHALDRVMAAAAKHPEGAHVAELLVWAADGRWRASEIQVTSLLTDPDIRGVILTIRDVSERRRMEEQLTRQAYTDGLTGLANRAFFTTRVEQVLAGAPRGTVGVLFLDLDGFKAVNDAQGHAVGDELLGLVAQRLRGCVRPDDLIARLGGDEFAILVNGLEVERAALWVAQRAQRVLASDFRIGGRATSLGASTGIAINDGGGETADQLLRNADLAMYRAKAMARSSFVRFEAQMHDALMHRVEAEKDLRRAAAAGDLRLHYQPLVDLKTGRVTGAEALMRWQHPTRGLLPPDDFIALAEETGLIHELGAWALAESARQGAAWQEHAPPGGTFRMSVNVSASQLTSGLPRMVRDTLAAARLPAGALTLEMTESVLLERTDEVTTLFRRLKQVGVRLALDDFGTGYSSLSYLARFPVDVLKIDRAFIVAMGSTSDHAELARTIVQLGRSLKLVTVAEGVETEEQRDQLAAMGCDLGQGFLFARPLPADELGALLRGGILLPAP